MNHIVYRVECPTLTVSADWRVTLSTSKQSPVRTVLAGLIGNVLEWFDYAVYGYFASNIASQFFPESDPPPGQYLTWGTFELGFFARPVGSLVLGRVGDRIGRRALLADWRPIVQTFGIVGMTNAAYYLTFTYSVDSPSM